MSISDYVQDFYKKLLLGEEAKKDPKTKKIITDATKGVLGSGGEFKRGGDSYLKDVTGLLGNKDVMMGLGLLAEGTRGRSPLQAGLRVAQIRKLLEPKDTRTNLQKNLISAGILPGTKEYRDAVLAGTVKTDVGAGSLGLVTKGKRDDANIAAEYAVGGLEKLKQVVDIAQTDPQAFGLTGKLLLTGKKITGEIDSFAKTFARDTAKIARRTGGLDAKLEKDLLDPKLTAIQLLENSLAIRLARTRNPTGRLLKDMIQDAKQDTKLSGLGGAENVIDKISFLAREFSDTAATQYQVGGKNQEFIKNKLSPYQTLFNIKAPERKTLRKKPITIKELETQLDEEE